ncbi:hypothetical protein ACVR1G_01910 [Streptococcus dentasini]
MRWLWVVMGAGMAIELAFIAAFFVINASDNSEVLCSQDTNRNCYAIKEIENQDLKTDFSNIVTDN